MTQEQLIQEARLEAEKVYPDIKINLHDSEELIRANVIRRRDNSLLIEGYIQCYIQQAEKRKSDMLRFAWWVDNNYISYTKGRYIDNKQPENPTLSEEEVYDIYLQQLKQE